MRVDLPSEPQLFDDSVRERLAHHIVGLVSRIGGASLVDLLVYESPPVRRGRERVDEPWCVDCRDAALDDLIGVVCARLVAAGFGVRDSYRVTDEHWMRVVTPPATATSAPSAAPTAAPAPPATEPPGWRARARPPIAPSPDAHSADSTAALGAAARRGFRRAGRSPSGAGGGGPSVRRPATGAKPGAAAGRERLHRGEFVPIEAVPEKRRARALATLAALDRGSGRREIDVVDELLSWRALLESEARLPSDARAVALVWSLRDRVIRDCVLMQCVWGFERSLTALAESNRPAEQRAESDSVFDTYLGTGAAPPSPAAVRRAIELLRALVEVAPASITAPPLTLLGWLEWSRGRGSVAARYLDAALAVDADHPLALLLSRLVDNGCIPEWLE